jgi:uncharacterized membrane protein YccC
MAPPPGSDPERRAWVLGILIGLPLTVGMLQVWHHWYVLAWVWTILFLFVGFLPRKRPTVKMITIALFVATYLALLIH